VNSGRRTKAIGLMLERIRQTAEEEAPGFPHFADVRTGRWTRSAEGDWTGGFWVGELWLAAAATRDPWFYDQASNWAGRLQARNQADTIFRGFLFWYGAAIGSITMGDGTAAEIAIDGASRLAGTFNEAAGLMPLGSAAEEAESVGPTETNIDGVPGVVPLLVWTGRRVSALEYIDRARLHAIRHIDLCVRNDGSVVQSASFDLDSGRTLRRYTHKGLTNESTWTRAQAWAMLGYAQALQWLGEDFRAVAYRVADWWIEHLPDDGVAWWDFEAPGSLRDTSGTAIAAAALLKLAEGPAGKRFRDVAEHMVDALVDRHLTGMHSSRDEVPGILTDGCYNRRIGLAVANELIWGDYMLLESLLHLDGVIDTSSL